MNKKMKLVSVFATMAMVATMGTSAFAAESTPTSEDANGEVGGVESNASGTEVWAGVAVDNPDMRIKVTVPTLFAFVVNGTVDTLKAESPISVEDGSLLIPNVKVENVTGGTPEGGDGATYNVTTTGSGTLTFENYSTYFNSTLASGQGDYTGMEVNVTGTIMGDVTSKWKPIAVAPTTGDGDKYKYRLSVNGTMFDTAQDGGYAMAAPLNLDAPSGVENGKNIDTVTKLAKTPYSEAAEFSVEVGGTRGDYNTAENSAKIGTIVWKVNTEAQTVPSSGA